MTELTDAQWRRIPPFVPRPAKTGRPRADDRQTLNGVLWVLRSGARWQEVPRQYGSPTTGWRRLVTWQTSGVWTRLWQALWKSLDAQDRLRWRQAFLEGSLVPAKGGRGVGVSRRGKGTQCTLVVERQGIPLAAPLASAQDHDVRWAQPTLAWVRVPQRRGRPRTRVPPLTADQGYDSRAVRQWWRAQGTASGMPLRASTPRRRVGRRPATPRHLARQRWRVERRFAWL